MYIGVHSVNSAATIEHDPLEKSQFISGGEFNRWLGWSLVLAAFVMAIGLDPWSLGETDAAVWLGSPQMYARHAQAVLLGMGFLNLAVARILCRTPSRPLERLVVALLGGGTIVYCVSYLAGVAWPVAHCFVPLGAAANFAGFAIWLYCLRRESASSFVFRVVLMVFCFGMLLDVVMGILVAAPSSWQPEFLGPLDGVRLRMMRLARAAVIALSLLSLLHDELLTSKDRLARWALYALLLGAVGMPLLLVSAAIAFMPLKYLLGLPAQAALAGVLVGVVLAAKRASMWEAWGWIIVALSMSAGLLMGLYAFDGPLAAPEFLGEYNDWNRRFSRLGHAYLIVLGLICILQARQAWGSGKDGVRMRPRWLTRAAVGVIAAATLLVPALIWTVVARNLPVTFLAPGPALAALGIALCMWLPTNTK